MIGESGRIVIEIEPEIKKRLYSILSAEGLSLKEWFLSHADEFIEGNGQLKLSFNETQKAKERENKK